MEYELYHHGTKGMKWGVRRYQNKDGTLTPAGKKRYDRDISENNAKKKENRIIIDGPDARRWVREDISRSKNAVDTTSKTVKDMGRFVDDYKPKREKLDLSKMSDKELRDRINRANMERQYNELFAPYNKPKLARGKEKTMKVLETAGTVLAVGSSALGIALAIKELKG